MKVCCICKRKKIEKNFYKNSSRRDGLQTFCKNCSKKLSHKIYTSLSKKDKEKRIKRVLLLKKRNRQFLWDYLKKHPCVDCGLDNPVVLEFDHLKDKIGNIAELAHKGCSIQTLSNEIAKCEVRCANCHRIKTAKQFKYYKNIKK